MTLEEAMIEHCAPTLAGVKSAGLFRFSPQEPGRFARAVQGVARGAGPAGG